MARIHNFFFVSLFSSRTLAAELCAASQDCWPSANSWDSFNASIGGRLVAPRPPAWPCHDPNYDEVACNEAKANWQSSFWRSNQTGAMENPLWDSPGCGVYQAADERNVIVIGGGANSVGAAGGWVQGGGHSPLGAIHGMGVDSVLQYNIVKPDEEIVTANACQNKGLFWAFLGGGGGTWGVTLDVTYKTHPPLDSIVAVIARFNTTAWLNRFPPKSFALVLIHPNTPLVESTNNTLAPLYDWVAHNTGATTSSSGTAHPTSFSIFKQYIPDIGIAVPSWLGGRLISSQSLLKNSTEISKLISGGGILTRIINIVGGGAVNDFDPDSTGLNPQWRKDALVGWNFAGVWPNDASPEAISRVKDAVNKYTQDLGELSGLDHAAYLNEANPAEPKWKQSFFGSHYDRLLEIKKEVDPDGLFICNRCVGSDL